MKQQILLPLVSICLLCAGCRSNNCQDVVKQTYIHKYGVPVAKSDWENQGKEGQIVQLRKDGITVTESYSQGGVLDGETTYTFPHSSSIHLIEEYNQGILISKKENYPSGLPFKQEIFRAGEQLAQLNKWYEDGTPFLMESYEDGYLVAGEYRTLLNVLEAKVQDGCGTRLCRSTEGALYAKETIESGLCVERVLYFTNGDPSAVIPFDSKGRIHGAYLTFLQGGLPDTVAQWEHGKPEGTTVIYQNGEKIAAIHYNAGKKHGIERRFRDGVTLVEEICWENNRRHGPHRMYIDGETKTEWYYEDELVSHITFEKLNPNPS